MPNPFMRIGTPSVSKKADDRPHAVEPIPEEYVGENNPYRGIQDHGVEPTGKPIGGPDYEDDIPAFYEEVKPDADPVPVRIVSAGGRELRRFNTWQEAVAAGTVRMIAGRNNARNSIVILNTGTDTIYVGSSESVASYTGFPVGAGGTLSLNTEDAVYAYAAAQQTVACIEEFSVKE